MPVYTRKGDEGQTHLADGARVNKDHARVDAYGILDELNSAIGLAAAHLKKENAKDLYIELCSQQHLLFELGSELAAYKDSSSEEGAIRSQDTQNLEKSMDRMAAKLPPMRNFILPGGSLSSASLDLARSICRRLERKMTKLMRQDEAQNKGEEEIVKKEAYRYINRLSDYLFMTARYANSLAACKDIEWKKRK